MKTRRATMTATVLAAALYLVSGSLGATPGTPLGVRAPARTAMVTGANRGIGLALVKELLGRGYRVIATVRDAKSATELLQLGPAVSVYQGVDLAKPRSLTTLARSLATAGEHLDRVVHNAGIVAPASLGKMSGKKMLAEYRVNAVGPVLLTQALREQKLLAPKSKIAFMSSEMGLPERGRKGKTIASLTGLGYGMAKSAAHMAAADLSALLKPDKIATAALHPGFVQTDMTGHRGDLSATSAAFNLVEVLEKGVNLRTSGRFWDTPKDVKTAQKAARKRSASAKKAQQTRRREKTDTPGSAEKRAPEKARVASLVRKYKMMKHPEGGYFAFADGRTADGTGDPRQGTIYYLMVPGRGSALHKLLGHQESWSLVEGDPVRMVTSNPAGLVEEQVLGRGRRQRHTATVPSDAWQVAESVGGKHGYSLVTCTTGPTFKLENWVAGTARDKQALSEQAGTLSQAAQRLLK